MAKATESEADALLAKYGLGTPPGPRCGVEKSGSRELIEALASRGITSARIAEIIQAEKAVRVPINTVQRHRRGVCSCGR